MTAPQDDHDLKHLFKLIRMLPGPVENREFWTAIQGQVIGQDTGLDYVYEKMTLISRVLRDPTRAHISDLSRYLLFFFGGNNPELWRILNHIFHDGLTIRHDEAGRYWAKDICETAWTLYVRYSYPTDDEWELKWQYKQDWLEWLPPRDARE